MTYVFQKLPLHRDVETERLEHTHRDIVPQLSRHTLFRLGWRQGVCLAIGHIAGSQNGPGYSQT